MEKALVTLFIEALLHFIGSLCAIYAFLPKAAVALGLKFVRCTTPTEDMHWLRQIVLWPLRWLVFSLSVVTSVSLLYGTAFLLYGGSKPPLIMVAGVVSVYIYGNEFAKFNKWFIAWFPNGRLFGVDSVCSTLLGLTSDAFSFLCFGLSLMIPGGASSWHQYVHDLDLGRPFNRMNFFRLAAQARYTLYFGIFSLVKVALVILTPFWRWGDQKRVLGIKEEPLPDERFTCKASGIRYLMNFNLSFASCVREFLLGVLETPLALVLLLTTLMIPWRGKSVLETVSASQNSDERRSEVVREIVVNAIDIATVAGGCVLSVSWRGPFFFAKFFSFENGDQVRRYVWSHLYELLLDIVDIPRALMAAVVTLTIWRAWPMWEELSRTQSRTEVRHVIQEHFRFWIIDIPCFFLGAFLMLTWRCKTLMRGFKLSTKKGYLGFMDAEYPPPPKIEADNPPPPKKVILCEWQKIVLHTFLEFLIDVPFPLLSVLTLWRFPLLLRDAVMRCSTTRQRRSVVVVHIIGLLKDIPCIFMSMLMVVTLWKIPALFRVVRTYQMGDDIHKEIFFLFLSWITDIPLFFVFLCICLAPWRLPSVLKELLFWNDINPHKVIRQHFVTMLLDYVSIFVAVLSLVTVFRFPTFLYHITNSSEYVKERCKEERKHSHRKGDSAMRINPVGGRGKKSIIFYRAADITIQCIIFDLWIWIMIAVICVTVIHVKELVSTIYWLTVLFNENKSGNKNHAHSTPPGDHVWNFNAGMRQRMNYSEGPKCPLTLCLYEPAISGMFFSALSDIPHLILAPVNALGYVLYPIGRHLSRNASVREEKVFSGVFTKCARYALSRLPQTIHFRNAHWHALWTVVALLFYGINTVSWCYLPVNVVWMQFATLGFPLWRGRLRSFQMKHQNALRIVVMILIVLTTPIAFVANICMLLWPFILYHKIDHPMFCLVFLGNAFLFVSQCSISSKIANRWFEWFSPSASYMWFFEDFARHRLWDNYISILVKITQKCYTLRRVEYLFVGEIILFFSCLLWVCWPLCFSVSIYPTLAIKNNILFVISVQLCVFLLHRVCMTVNKAWHDMTLGTEKYKHHVKLLSVVPVFIENSKYGFGLEFHVQKEADAHFKQARMILRNNFFWTRLSYAMGPFWASVIQAAFHPLVLFPTYMDPTPFEADIEDVQCRFTFGTENQSRRLKVSRKMLIHYLTKATEGCDPVVEIVIDYGHYSFGMWITEGRATSFSMHINSLLQALLSPTPINLVEVGGVWLSHRGEPTNDAFKAM